MQVEGSTTYFFKAVAPEGTVTSGDIEAENRSAAIAALFAKGYRPLRLEGQPLREPFWQREVGIGAPNRMTIRDAQSFCKDLYILLDSGVEVSEALAIALPSLSRRSTLYRFSALVRQGLRFGRSLSGAIAHSGFSVPSDMVPVVRAGEASASLANSLKMLAEGYEERGRFARSVGGALVYPAFLLGVAILTLGIIGFFVAPNLSGLFLSMNKPVPLVISTLGATSAFLSANWLVLLAAIVLATAATIALARNPGVRDWLKGAAYRMPIAGPILIWSATQQFAATLKLYVDSNVPMATALPGAIEASGFPRAQSVAQSASNALRRGGTVEAASGLIPHFPAKVLHLIAVGERSGRLSEVLAAASGEAKSQFQGRVAVVSSLLAPVLILAVGIMVGGLIFSVFSALLEVNNLAS